MLIMQHDRTTATPQCCAVALASPSRRTRELPTSLPAGSGGGKYFGGSAAECWARGHFAILTVSTAVFTAREDSRGIPGHSSVRERLTLAGLVRYGAHVTVIPRPAGCTGRQPSEAADRVIRT